MIGGQLYSDAMGNDGTEDGTYIGMLYHNTQAITTALGGETLELPTGLTPWSDYWSEQ
jgi:manganese/zinc/iron transport system substrate-binding protein